MRRRIITIGNTDIYLHLGTVLFAVYAAVVGQWTMLAASLLSILLHEGAHALAAAACGQPPKEMEITPLGAVLRLEDEERIPLMRRLFMIVAGPMMTLCLCLLALHGTIRGWCQLEAGRRYFAANAAILAVNLLPALPLDGGRLLSLILGCFLRPETLRRIIRAIGTVTGLAAIALSVWLAGQYGSWNWSLSAVGCFLLYSASTATTTAAMAQLRLLMDRKIMLESRGHAPCRGSVLLADQPLHRAVRHLAPRKMTCFLLMERGSMRCIGWLDEQQLIAGYLEQPDMSCRDLWRKIQDDAIPQTHGR